MRNSKVLSDYQQSSGEKAKDPVAPRVSLSSANVVGGVDGHTLPIDDLGDTVGDGETGLRTESMPDALSFD